MKKQETEKGDEEMKQRCNLCGKCFKNIRALCGHKRSHSKRKKSPDFEVKSKKSYKFGGNLKKNVFGTKCGKGLSSFKGLNGHMKVHSGRDSGQVPLTVSNNTPREKRSVRRYKVSKFCCGRNFSVNDDDSEERLLEIASCLLMLAGEVSVTGSESKKQECRIDVETNDSVSCCNDSVKNGVNVADLGVNFDAVKKEFGSVEESVKFLGLSCKENDESEPGCKVEDEITGISREKLMFDGESEEANAEFSGFGVDFDIEDESEMRVTKTVDEITGIPQEGLISDRMLGSKSRMKIICNFCTRGFRSEHALRGHRINCPISCRSCITKADIQSEPVVSQKLGFESLELGTEPDASHKSVSENVELGVDIEKSVIGIQSEPVESLKASESIELGVDFRKMKSIRLISERDIQSEPAASQKSQPESVELDVNHGKKRLKRLKKLISETDIHSEPAGSQSESVDHEKKRTRRCLICSREFSSGQALGGHMRAHLQGDSRTCEKKNDVLDHEISGGALLPVA